MNMVERRERTILLTVELLSRYSICEENVPSNHGNVLFISASGRYLRLDANSAFIFTTVAHVFPVMTGRYFTMNSMPPTRSCITPNSITSEVQTNWGATPIHMYGA